MIGKYLVDLKEYSHSNDCKLQLLDTEINLRISKNEFISTIREKNKKIKNRIKNVLEM